MNKCPFCNIELVENKCKSCGFHKTTEELEKLEKIEKLRLTRERFKKIFEDDEDDSEIDLREKIETAKEKIEIKDKIEIAKEKIEIKERIETKESSRILFDEDSPTKPQEVTGLNKLIIPLEPLESEKINSKIQKKFDEDSPTIPQKVVGLNNLKIEEEVKKKENPMLSITKDTSKDTKKKLNPFVDKVNKLDSSVKNREALKENKKSSNSLTQKEILEQNEKLEKTKEAQKEFIVAGFFKRTLIALMDQTIILAITYLFFITMIKPELNIIYKSFEAIASFIIEYESQFYTLIFAYLAINFIYYTVFNIILSGTPASRLFGYKLYKNEKRLSIIVVVIRNMLLLPLNLLFLLPYLFIFVSDFKQSLYDMIFKTYLAKESR